jgi:WD40 repeat protein
MIKKSLTILALIAIFASTLNAQWTNEGAWPDTSYKGGTHGIAVDPDGKVWVSSYYQDTQWVPQEGDTIATSGILVFNADGTEADFSPINFVTTGGGFVVDTLNGACRGLEADENGNILYVQSGPAKAIKINYQTGEGMAVHLTTEHGSSPTGAGIADDGTIFIGPVVGGGTTAIAMYDTDLNYLGNAVDAPPNISRVLEVSADGNTIYWHAFTGPIETIVYHREDEFSAFDSVDVILQGLSVESSEFNPATGKLWVSNDVRGWAPFLSHATWYEYDVETGVLMDYFTWSPNDDVTEYPRGLDFSPDGSIAYAGTFTNTTPRIQKFMSGPVGVGPDIVNNATPDKYQLAQNYPNPFNPSTVINFSVPETAFVTLKVYNMLGQEVAVLVNDIVNAGSHKVNFRANNLATGMYVYMIQAGEFSASKKMMLMK